jgi:hypothetical protein
MGHQTQSICTKLQVDNRATLAAMVNAPWPCRATPLNENGGLFAPRRGSLVRSRPQSSPRAAEPGVIIFFCSR